MLFIVSYSVSKFEKGQNVYFSIRWSPIQKADKYRINCAVPAMGGIAELYYKDKYGKINRYMITRSFYGGIRSTLRTAIDPELEKDERRLKIITEYEDELYFRYTLIESLPDMNDILFFYMSTYSPKSKAFEHSGRYKKIYVKEIDNDKIVTI